MSRPPSPNATRSVLDVTDMGGQIVAYRWSTHYPGTRGEKLRKEGKVSIAPILRRMGAKGTYEKARREAEKQAWSHIEAFASGHAVKKEERITVRTWSEYCLENVLPLEGMKPRSLDELAKALRRHVYPQLGNVPLASLTPEACVAWYRWLRETEHPREYRDGNGEITRIVKRRMSVKTAENVKGYFSTVLGRARAMNRLAYNPADAIPINRTERQDHKEAVRAGKLFLSSAQASALRTACKRTGIYGLVLCGLDLGTRIAEANGLLFEHLRLDEGEHGVAYVRNQVQRYRKAGEDQTRLHDQAPKSRAGYRPLLLSAELRAETDRRIAAMAAGEIPRSRYVFGNSLGNPHTYSTIHEAFGRVCAEAGIVLPPRNSTHILRRYFTNTAQGAGVGEEIRAQVAGHERYETTMLAYEDVDQASYRRLFAHVHAASYAEERAMEAAI